MKTCARCSAEFADAQLVFSAEGEVCPPCAATLDAGAASAPARLGPVAIVGLVAGLAPFALSVRSSQTTTVNGQVVASSSIDYIAQIGGGIALLAGLVALVAASRAAEKKRPAAIAGAVLLLGALQLARGFGLL